jgi:hypothetical protein
MHTFPNHSAIEVQTLHLTDLQQIRGAEQGSRIRDAPEA